jgi:glucose-1-phosphate thymidylyltransferase
MTRKGISHKGGSGIRLHPVTLAPERYGEVEFDKEGRANSIEEKPSQPKFLYAVIGLNFYDSNVVKISRSVKLSSRGGLEITDVSRNYLQQGQLNVAVMGRGIAWLDTGTHDSLLEAGQFVATLEKRQELKVACPEEIAWRNGWLSDEQLETHAHQLGKSGYVQYLKCLLAETVISRSKR